MLCAATDRLDRLDFHDVGCVSRKERQVRARLAELKLEQAGMTDLLNNPDLLKLVG